MGSFNRSDMSTLSHGISFYHRPKVLPYLLSMVSSKFLPLFLELT